MSYRIFVKNREIFFIHIPKNAGNAILYFLTRLHRSESEVITNTLTDRNYHSTLCHAIEQYPQVKDNFTFTVIRDPWSRAISWFFYRKKILYNALMHNQKNGYLPDDGNLNDDVFEIENEYLLMEQGFNTWIDVYKNTPWDNTWFSFSTNQVDWIDHPTKRVDLIIRQENFAKDYKSLMKILKLPKRQKVYKIHKTNYTKDDVKSLFDQESKTIIHKIFERDIDRFEFTF